MKIFLVVFVFIIFPNNAYGTMKITTTQNYYIPMRRIGINCTSTVQVDDNITEINIGSTEIQIANIAYIESTGQCLTAPPGGSIINAIDCQTECSCSLNGRSIFFVYNVTSENQTLTFKCFALQNKNLLSDTTVIKKAHGPSNISINATSPVTAREGDPVGPISCTADDCVPDCTYSWTGPGFLENGSVLHIRNIKRENKGIYECTAFNIFDTTTDNIDVIVHYVAKIILVNVFNITEKYASENASLHFICEATGIPRPTIRWFFTDTVGRTYLVSNKASFSIQSASCTDTGNYTCEAHNEGFIPHSLSKEVNVACVPRLLINCSSSSEKILTVRRYDSLTIIACFLSNPQPLPKWIRQDGNNTVSIMDPAKSHLYKNSTILNTATVDIALGEEGKVNVTVNAKNLFAVSSTTSFRIWVIDRPDKPSDITCSTGYNYIVVNWQPQFNGGSPQSFRVFYKNIFESIFTVHPTVVSEKKDYSVKIKNLRPSSVYILRVNAINIYNTTESDEVLCKTLPAGKASSTFTAGIGTGIGIAVLVLITAVIIIAFIRRYRRFPASSTLYEETECKASPTFLYDELQDNTKGGKDKINPQPCQRITQESKYDEVYKHDNQRVRNKILTGTDTDVNLKKKCDGIYMNTEI